jgi:CheY-like chemotaxis protein
MILFALVQSEGRREFQVEQITKDSEMDISKMNFIVVDDDQVMLEIIGAALTTFGAQSVIKCPSGIAAINALSNVKQTFHCIISDYSMTPISGLELLKGIRMGRYEHVPRELPFIMVTVSGKQRVVQAALALDVSAYLMKPINQKTLNTALNRAAGKLIMTKPPEEYAKVDLTID